MNDMMNPVPKAFSSSNSLLALDILRNALNRLWINLGGSVLNAPAESAKVG